MPPPLVGVADPASLAALDVPWKARALRCLDLARMVFHILLAHASSPLDPPVHRGGMAGVMARLGQRISGLPEGTTIGDRVRVRTWNVANLPSTGCAKRCDGDVGIARDRRSAPRPGGGPRDRPRRVPQRHPKLIREATCPILNLLDRDPARSRIEAVA